MTLVVAMMLLLLTLMMMMKVGVSQSNDWREWREEDVESERVKLQQLFAKERALRWADWRMKFGLPEL